MNKVGVDDLLKISYKISHRNKLLEEVASSEAVEYRMGEGNWPIQLELAMLGEITGSCLKIQLMAKDDAFGRVDPDRIMQMDRLDFSSQPQPGELIEFEFEHGEPVEGQVLRILDDKIEVDFNHPYAGRDLDIEIQIKSIL
jgi:FKBP-type peptidyl-prolyl cis-trans isomerase SlpA